jgi:hypothetical protein
MFYIRSMFQNTTYYAIVDDDRVLMSTDARLAHAFDCDVVVSALGCLRAVYPFHRFSTLSCNSEKILTPEMRKIINA